ncbi:dihydropteroate synthase [Corynebacterium mendelii]|uniref:dihydropteroate synthase n=1 Tax=Corynebacterium mendelii TaxID=2765362 RepID=A0A939E460_9CORY|nr:dihydropteroate synthase [Corynebacterium mendelii]MBN9645092.1 dihydropteroate synthase [Corynebacterium mendelii]
MGIVNVTDDSFSDGGRYIDHDRAIAHGTELAAAGAAIVDVGGESTRPGATRVTEHQELDRVIPVVEQLSAAGIAVSVDTMRAEVARQAAAAGAVLINDVSGGLADNDMYAAIADAGIACCLMHWKTDRFGDAAGLAGHHPDTIVDEVRAHLDRLAGRAAAAGVGEHLITVDPGLGFAKTPADNWALIRGLDTIMADGRPVLVGASRKRFLQQVRSARRGQVTPVDADGATVALTALVAAKKVWAVRTHEVAANVDACQVAALVSGRAGGSDG